MMIAIAGPYSAETAAQREINLAKLNQAAATIYNMGHIPIIGVNAALPVVNMLPMIDSYKTIMDISMAVVERCDALLLLAESAGANKERDLILSLGKPVFYRIEDVR